jgi:hypothetical protein
MLPAQEMNEGPVQLLPEVGNSFLIYLTTERDVGHRTGVSLHKALKRNTLTIRPLYGKSLKHGPSILSLYVRPCFSMR